MEKKKRNKPTIYEVDIHIRTKKSTFEKIKKISEEKKIGYSKLIREIIEKGIDNML